jgi:hypothetical protein
VVEVLDVKQPAQSPEYVSFKKFTVLLKIPTANINSIYTMENE